MNIFSKLLPVFFIFAALASHANEAFLVLVREAAGQPLNSPKWQEVIGAFNVEVNLDYAGEDKVSCSSLLMQHNPRLLIFLVSDSKKPKEFQKLLVSFSSQSPEVLDERPLRELSIRTLLALQDPRAFALVFGSFKHTEAWLILSDAYKTGDARKWWHLQEWLASEPKDLRQRCSKNSETIWEILDILHPVLRDSLIPPDYLLGFAEDGDIKSLGSGLSGIVWRAKIPAFSDEVAVKVLSKAHYDFRRIPWPPSEIDTCRKLMTLAHPNILALHDIIEQDGVVCLIMQLATGGDVFADLQKMHFTEEKARSVFCQLANGVDFLHKNGFCHRDIKPENLVYDQDGKVRLIDFGLAAPLTDKLLDTYCGSPDFAAPELWKRQPYCGRAADIWAMGVCLFVFRTRVLPFKDVSDIVNLRYTWPNRPSAQAPLKAFFGRVFVDASKRMTMDEIIKCDWLNPPNKR